jgi:UDP-N-acetyl-D-galactosamine dehydrogenase
VQQELLDKKKKISVTGLGYVGLPLALEMGRYFSVIGFDINSERVEMMNNGVDPSNELDDSAFKDTDVFFTSNPEDLTKAHFHIVAVPTPVDEHKVPNLIPVFKASESIGQYLKKGDYVVYESTVYPGCTEEDCVPILEKQSGLKACEDFKVGYSPERIVPGDKVKTLTTIAKVVSGCDEEALDVIADVYGQIITAGIHKAASIRVAEAAKVIENTQRDLNISLMNELSIIFDKLDIDTQEVLEAASTKWNFLKFYPGLVGGHCISVDPYYLLHKSKQIGYDPQVILSGRRINDSMPSFIAKRLVQLLIQQGKGPGNAKVLVMGVTFKENVSDIRNSKVADLIRELMQYSINVHVTDPFASPNEVAHEYGLTLIDTPSDDYDAVIVAVNHKQYRKQDFDYYKSIMKEDPILMDIKGIYEKPKANNGLLYWRL